MNGLRNIIGSSVDIVNNTTSLLLLSRNRARAKQE